MHTLRFYKIIYFFKQNPPFFKKKTTRKVSHIRIFLMRKYPPFGLSDSGSFLSVHGGWG